MKESKDENKQSETDVSSATCERVEDRIHELMDLRQPLLSDETVRQHVSECDACAELVVDFGALDDSLSQIPVATLQRLSGLQLADAEPAAPTQMHPVFFVASIACLLLVMLTSSIWFSPRGSADSLADRAVVADMSSGDDSQQYVSTGPIQALESIPSFGNSPNSAEFINAVSLDQFSGGVEPYQDYLGITADLPGIEPVYNSVNATFQLIRFISERHPAPKEEQPADSPDVGCYGGPFMQLCSV